MVEVEGAASSSWSLRRLSSPLLNLLAYGGGGESGLFKRSAYAVVVMITPLLLNWRKRRKQGMYPCIMREAESAISFRCHFL